jgi:hypothetical protein
MNDGIIITRYKVEEMAYLVDNLALPRIGGLELGDSVG